MSSVTAPTIANALPTAMLADKCAWREGNRPPDESAQSADMTAPSATGSVTGIEAMNTYAISIQLIF